MAILSAGKVQQVVEYLRNGRKGSDLSLDDVMRLAEAMAESLREVFKTVDEDIYSELGSITSEIAVMKVELSKMRLADVSQERIPNAGLELDAVVEATEKATNTIMSAAETIMCADPSDFEAYQTTVNDNIMVIFEACSFQDITGQRINKVVTTLGHVDERISKLVERLKVMKIADGPVEETAAERRARELILHGPQLAGEGVSQDEIDALLA